jgi:hypothetical protein
MDKCRSRRPPALVGGDPEVRLLLARVRALTSECCDVASSTIRLVEDSHIALARARVDAVQRRWFHYGFDPDQPVDETGEGPIDGS